ncbi:CU044_5270 family protein [Streptomyces sp. ISL-22]|uniref:CU044_5270 family protein n=1 Tax=unclassified Streptomyces TaxID=2593676 RepID=UPI001BE7884F|nr:MULTISPECIES: CU044_5270 family protein [unclassified Streptomyces]MBT2420702.1 CU044_5270 family protein [Streptomyces sp. ISL-24]MBT2434833.1 CU044_5270 family protein [Streptomyces sp. ISL-22]
MKNDVLHRLTAARPAHLDPDLPTPSPVREEELATVMSRPRAARRARAAARPRKVGRPLLSGLALATATAVAALVISDTAPEKPGPAPSATSGSGSQVLLAAASRVERQPADSGRYWYVEERMGSLHKVPGKNYTIDVRTEQRYWTAAAKNKYWSQSVDSGARPATEADEAAWKADGSPTSWKLTSETDGIVTYAGKGEIEHDAPGGGADSVPYGEVPLRLLPTLPTDAKALRKRLSALVDKGYNAPERVLDQIVVSTARQLATSLPSSPALRAAAYRLLAAEPGVRSLGDVKDHTGRTGYAVALPSPYESAPEIRLIFDKSTGMPLGTETVATRSGDGVSKGELLSYTTITAMKWTDEAPPFDTDTPDPGPVIESDR